MKSKFQPLSCLNVLRLHWPGKRSATGAARLALNVLLAASAILVSAASNIVVSGMAQPAQATAKVRPRKQPRSNMTNQQASQRILGIMRTCGRGRPMPCKTVAAPRTKKHACTHRQHHDPDQTPPPSVAGASGSAVSSKNAAAKVKHTVATAPDDRQWKPLTGSKTPSIPGIVTSKLSARQAVNKATQDNAARRSQP